MGTGWSKAMSKMASEAAFDPHAFLATIDRGQSETTYRPREIIFSQGAPADAIFYVKRGKVKLSVTSEGGREAILGLFGEGSFLGEATLIGQPARFASATAMTECALVRIPKAEMLRALRRRPELADLFTAHLLARNTRVEADLADHLLNSSEKRLARTLLLLANVGKESGPEPISAQISQEVLAEMVGTTRSRISYFMNKFRSAGFIDYNGQITVNNSLLAVLLPD